MSTNRTMSTDCRVDTPMASAWATWDGSRTIAWLSGEFDLATADRLVGFLVGEATNGSDVVVDLSGVSFMDASTISAIVSARAHLAERSRTLTVRSPSTLAKRVLGICGLDELIEPEEAAHVERAGSALESWVAVRARYSTPSNATRPAPEDTRPAPEEAHEASRE